MSPRIAWLCLVLSHYPTVPLPAQQATVDIQSYQFRIDLPDTGNVIRGWASVAFAPRRGYDDTLRLDLVSMTVDHVYDLRGVSRIPFSYDGQVLKIRTRGSVMVEYHGTPRDGLIISTNARGRRSFFGDNWPNRARYWLPTVDHPSDKARVLWSVRAPRGMRVVTNAPQCRRADAQTGRRAECNESAPIPTYTMVLAAAPMTLSVHRAARSGTDTIPIEVLAFAEDSVFADSVPFKRATEIVEAMSRIAGPFPYSRLAHVQSSTRYGGMENSTAIFYDQQGYVRRTMHESTVRHETAHQWFGDAVTEADWHHIWLSEGFATYFDLVIGAALDGDSLLIRGLRDNARSYMASPDVERPIIDTTITDPNKLLNENSYQKGGWVLHMLRGVVGDSAFFRGIRNYYATYRDSSVLTDHFQAVMERAHGGRLSWFFAQWLHQPGYPKLDVTWHADTLTRQVTLEIAQVQSSAWGTFGLPAVMVEFRRAGRVLERQVVRLTPDAATQQFTVGLSDIPDSVVIDPDGQLLLTATVKN